VARRSKTYVPKPTFPGSGNDIGDRITVSVTHLTKYRGHEFWHKTELSGRIRPGESGLDATRRLDLQLQDMAVRGVKSTCITLDQNDAEQGY
jgi:hypothetical protein